MQKKIFFAAIVLLAFAAGLFFGGRRPAVVHAQTAYKVDRPSTAALPGSWGSVKAALLRNEVTLVLEDKEGTIRTVILEKALNDKGEPAVSPRLYTVVPRQ